MFYIIAQTILVKNCLQLAALLPASWQSCKQFRPIISFHFPYFFTLFFSSTRDFSQTKEKKRGENRNRCPDATARSRHGSQRGRTQHGCSNCRRAGRGTRQ
jgi:hypothetical protein